MHEKNVPKKTRFLNFGKVSEIRIDEKDGAVVQYPRYYDIQREIDKGIDSVKTIVDKALVKVGSDNFSRLPFGQHMHTPFLDILSFILLNDKIDMQNGLSSIPEESRRKYLENLDLLEKVGLVRKENEQFVPGNPLIQIESGEGETHQKLAKAMAYFFENGYEYIDSIRQVLGPHLLLSSFCYEQSIEYGEIVPITQETISNVFFNAYRKEDKGLKLPRYLLQLEEVGLLREKTIRNTRVWQCDPILFSALKGEEEILAPISAFIG